VAPDGTVYVTEMAGRCVSRIVAGRREVVAELGGSPNGAAFDVDGTLYVANGGGRWTANPTTHGRPGHGGGVSSVQRLDPDGSWATILTSIDGVPLNSPNDIVGDESRGFYFTDPSHPSIAADGSQDIENMKPGSVCYLAADGTAVRLHTGLRFPNGIQISDDAKELFVSESGTGTVHRFPILSAGRVGPPEPYVELGEAARPDGMCFDVEGRLLVAGHETGHIFVIAPGGGTVERTVEIEDPDLTNLCFGGPQGKTLHVTCASLGVVVAIDWPVAGMRLHPDRTWGRSTV
jgi:gluconolactonase